MSNKRRPLIDVHKNALFERSLTNEEHLSSSCASTAFQSDIPDQNEYLEPVQLTRIAMDSSDEHEDASVESWQLCQNWMRRLFYSLVNDYANDSMDEQLIREKLAALQFTDVTHFANFLRSGDVLCLMIYLVNSEWLPRISINFNTGSSVALMHKNLDLFLKTCREKLRLKKDDIFEVPHLSEGTEFGKVLKCLSSLSQSNIFQKTIYDRKLLPNPGAFAPFKIAKYRLDFNDDDVYLDVNREYFFYVDTSIEKDRTSEPETSENGIYVAKAGWLNPFNELIENERIYNTDVLQSLTGVYRRTCKESKDVSEQDFNLIFVVTNLDEMSQMHAILLGEMVRFKDDPHNFFLALADESILRGIVSAYYSFMVNYDKVQQIAQHLVSKPPTKELLSKVARELAGAKKVFSMAEFLCRPFQRCLRIKLLLSTIYEKLLKSDEPQDMKDAAKACADQWGEIGLHINQCKSDRDLETGTIPLLAHRFRIAELERTPLLYGRHLKDELIEVSIDCGSRRIKMTRRHVVLFEKALFHFKATSYSIDSEDTSFTVHAQDRIMLATCKITKKGSVEPQSNKGRKHSISPSIIDVENTSQTISMYFYVESQARAWHELLTGAVSRCGEDDAYNKHFFKYHNFKGVFHRCMMCKGLLRGYILQGHTCVKCGIVVHAHCRKDVPMCTGKNTNQTPDARLTRLSSNFGIPTSNSFSSSPIHTRKFVTESPSPEDELGLHHYPWFVGVQSKQVAAANIDRLAPGSYLVRKSDRSPGYAICLNTGVGNPRHLKIANTENPPSWYLHASKQFTSLPNLIEYFSQHNLSEMFQGQLDCKLEHSFLSAVHLLRNSFEPKLIFVALAKSDIPASDTCPMVIERGLLVLGLSELPDSIFRADMKPSSGGKTITGEIPLSFLRFIAS